ncbi:Glucose-6-phosphate 1-dehydrogenase [Astathelohania contejeani]|uniref:Glucose-6-phosphate 1-dehydrogenase n=1 Tax=Astathelohania contejeani TaxID=164912 RepID=A0ABQ7I2B0_9MICR|nr:Glucose-6-phosphate 1-dehydrogenase [Thelohania contejeani]
MKIVIFGASGDLAKRKLFPSISHVEIQGININVIGYSRKNLEDTFHKKLCEFNEYSNEFLKNVKYIQGEYKNLDVLKVELKDETWPIYYFSVPPEAYSVLLTELHHLPPGKIAIEKPFGSDLECFKVIKAHIENHNKSHFYFIDHYLLKETAVAIPEILAKNFQLACLLDNNGIMNVEIIFKEQLGGEGRVYFDKYGIIKDVIQNHLCEIYALIASNIEDWGNELHIGAKRLDVLRSTLPINTKECLFGQYDTYTKELGKDSNTETFATVVLRNKSKRWKNVPFVISAGKGMDKKECRIVLEIKRLAYGIVSEILLKTETSNKKKKKQTKVPEKEIISIKLIFEISPSPSVYFSVEFSNSENTEYILYEEREIKEMAKSKFGLFTDHEIIFNSLVGDQAFPVAGVEEAEEAWNIFNSVLECKNRGFFIYKKGIDFPDEATSFIKKIKEESFEDK